ncbi:MAG: hypothetical protein WCJ30_22490, partial [Deltaproteobacteria bacterium]
MRSHTLAAALASIALVVTGLPRPRPAQGDADPPPPVRASPIPFGPERLAQTEAYSLRHYGDSSWHLAPRAIVLHYTCGPSFRSA